MPPRQWASGEPIEKVERYAIGGGMRHLGGDTETMIAAFQAKPARRRASGTGRGGFWSLVSQADELRLL